MPSTLLDPITPSPSDVELAKVSSRSFSHLAGRKLNISPQRKGERLTETIEIPAGAVPIIEHVLACMAKGLAVSLVPVHSQLTTQEAADLLGVSRPFLIKLLEQKAIPFTKVNRHRRIILQDLLAYKRRMHADRQKSLDELTQLCQELGLDQ